MTSVSTLVSSLPSWRRIFLIIYVLANVKSLPFAWHLRVLYHYLRNVSRRAIPPKPVLGQLGARPPPSSVRDGHPDQQRRDIFTHPLFQPVSLTTRSPLLESDYNLHKSNSTYFADMDVSRTKLVTRLFAPGWRKINTELEGEGCKGRMFVALGGVHTSFKKEVGIYEKVEVRSRVCTWDAKWVVVISYFVRRSRKNGQNVSAGALREAAEEELCAVGLSKYVFKKGRFTIKPGRMLQLAGWLPKEPAAYARESCENGIRGDASRAANAGDSSLTSNQPSEPVGGGCDGKEGLRSKQIPDIAERVVLDEQTAAAASSTDVNSITSRNKGGKESAWNPEAWSWEAIEEERQRGLRLARSWLALDLDLYREFEGGR